MGRFGFRRLYPTMSIHQAFLHCFAAVLTEQHPFTGCAKVNDEEISRVFAEKDLDSALESFTRRIPIESQGEYPAYHLNWYHRDKVFRMLKDSGFSSFWRSAFGQSRSPAMSDIQYFDKTKPWMSLYVEAQK